MLFADNMYEIILMHNTFTVSFPQLRSFGFPHCTYQSPFFYLLGDPSFGDRGANIHPLSSPVSDQLFIPCFLTLPNPSRRHPWFMLHVYIDDITTLATVHCLIQYSSRWNRSTAYFIHKRTLLNGIRLKKRKITLRFGQLIDNEEHCV
jgi:hypothetical protein